MRKSYVVLCIVIIMLCTAGVAGAAKSPSKPSPVAQITSSVSGTIEYIGKDDAKQGDVLVKIHVGNNSVDIKAVSDGFWISDPKLKINNPINANQIIGYFLPKPKK